MTGTSTPVMLVTANVGSIFEDPSHMLQAWADEFLSFNTMAFRVRCHKAQHYMIGSTKDCGLTMKRLDPKFVALHCQEVGGKNYEKSMQYVQNFVKLLMDSEELRLFNKVRIYLDEDFSSADKFTALGSFYFIHDSLSDALIYDFESHTFQQLEGKFIYREDVETEPTKEKSKFPLEYFPECKWSRKGFLRTRWCINGTIFDLVNIHLFHDASNIVAIESFPSEYCETRRQALTYTLDRFKNDEHDNVPIFIFGDFNFRTDTKGVVKKLSEGLSLSLSDGDNEDSTVEYCNDDEKVLCLGKKTFSHSKHQDIFCGEDAEWLRDFDKELESFKDQLFEFAITFQPSYPYEEGESDGTLYMKTRCPAWCDRVLLTNDAVSLVKDVSNQQNVEYRLMGTSSCMGDHKPVYLRLDLRTNRAKSIEYPIDSNIDSMKIIGDGDGDAIYEEEIIVADTGQDDRWGVVKRVNSASLVENKCKREDWKSSRCNSDVSWNPTTSKEVVRKSRDPLFRAESKIRIKSTTNINLSLPRLTSHHSSSEEDWFEIVDDEDDNDSVLRLDRDEIIDSKEIEVDAQQDDAKHRRRKSRFSILKRLRNEKNESRFDQSQGDHEPIEDNLEMPSIEVPGIVQTSSKNQNTLVAKTQTFLKRVKRSSSSKNDDSGSWETIDLSGAKAKDDENKMKVGSHRSCCSLQ